MKITFVSLGCDKNLVDSEMMLGQLLEHGYEFTDDETLADVIVVNTCCFIGDAKEESINTLLEMAQLKQNGNLIALIAAGCLAQRYREEIKAEIPEVDAIIGDGRVAIEFKSCEEVQSKHTKGLRAFSEDFPDARLIIVSLDRHPRLLNGIEVLPATEFLRMMWQGDLF